MSTPRDGPHQDLFRPALDDIIDLNHPLARLARDFDWTVLEDRIRSVCSRGPGQPPLPSRLVAGLFVLKRLNGLSDEALCARWLENPYDQYFCGELHFRRKLPFDRSSLARWRRRLGETEVNQLIDRCLLEAGAVDHMPAEAASG